MNKLPDPVATATREQAFALVVAGIAAGMPIPADISINNDHPALTLHLIGDNPGGVWQWVTHLGMPDPSARRRPFESSGRWLLAFESEVRPWDDHRALTGWWITVDTFMTVEAPASTEQAAAVTR